MLYKNLSMPEKNPDEVISGHILVVGKLISIIPHINFHTRSTFPNF